MILVMNDSSTDGRIDDGRNDDGNGFTISCDACMMQATSACADCVVTFLLDEGLARERAPAGVVTDLDDEQAGQPVEDLPTTVVPDVGAFAAGDGQMNFRSDPYNWDRELLQRVGVLASGTKV